MKKLIAIALAAMFAGATFQAVAAEKKDDKKKAEAKKGGK